MTKLPICIHAKKASDVSFRRLLLCSLVIAILAALLVGFGENQAATAQVRVQSARLAAQPADPHLASFPRPLNDNGRGIHFDLDPRPNNVALYAPYLGQMKIKWATVYGGDELQVTNTAKYLLDNFGVYSVMRVEARPGNMKAPDFWLKLAQLAVSEGIPPYIQIFNEPEIEWDTPAHFAAQWGARATAVVSGGGYPGLQVLSKEYFDAVVLNLSDQVKNKMFFALHNYGSNHPPAYPYPNKTIMQDDTAVLRFLEYAQWFKNDIGFVPPMLGGEGGWLYQNHDDNTMPAVDIDRWVPWHYEMYNWFRYGQLSNGDPLPDYLFSVNPWILHSTTFYSDSWIAGLDSNLKQRLMDELTTDSPYVRQFGYTAQGTSTPTPTPSRTATPTKTAVVGTATPTATSTPSRTATPTQTGVVRTATPVSTSPPSGTATPTATLSACTLSVAKTISLSASPKGMAVDPVGQRVFVGLAGSSSVAVINAITNKVLSTWTSDGQGSTNGVAFSQNKLFLSKRTNAKVSVLDASTGKFIKNIAVGSAPYGMAASDTRVWVANFNDGTISLIDAGTNSLLSTRSGSPFPSLAAALGSRVFITAYGGGLMDIDSSNNILKTISTGSGSYGVAVDVGANRVYVSNRDSKTVSVVDATNDAVVNSFTGARSPYGLAVNPVTKHLFIDYADSNAIRVRDANTLASIVEVALGTQGPNGGDTLAVLGNFVYVGNYAAKSVTVISDCPGSN
jgi:YVTN family beta-propeller protein